MVPEYVEPPHQHVLLSSPPEHLQQIEQARLWQRWAKERLDLLTREVGKTADELTVVKLETSKATEALEKERLALKGLEAWLKSRKEKSVDCLEVGTAVTVRSGSQGIIEEVVISKGGTQYLISWWSSSRGERFQARLHTSEFTVDDDAPLPLPRVLE